MLLPALMILPCTLLGSTSGNPVLGLMAALGAAAAAVGAAATGLAGAAVGAGVAAGAQAASMMIAIPVEMVNVRFVFIFSS